MSRLMPRRETIIALRARHTAFRIAVDILYPQQSPPPLAQPAMPIVEQQAEVQRTVAQWKQHIRWEMEWARHEARVRGFKIAILITALSVLLAYLVYDATKSSTPPLPPPPQGRPILPAAE
jgi:hypothetical protein